MLRLPSAHIIIASNTAEKAALSARAEHDITLPFMVHRPQPTAATAHHAEDVIQTKPQRSWKSYVWDTFDKSPEERRFLFKLDAAVLTFASLGYLIKYLDQTNINSAFVSGMKEDLGLYGNQLNYMQTCWTVGYVIGEIPSNLILTRVRPSVWIPTLEVVWSVLTFCLSQANDAKTIYAIRFLVGLAEGGFYPGMQYLIGSWYRRDELAKRSCIFHCASPLAQMFSGYLMAGATNLEGKGGYHGWQWLFIIDGIISLPIALSGYFLVPDMPETSRALYLTQEERAFGKRRMELEGRKGRQPFTRTKVLGFFKSWHIYLLTLLYITFNNGNNGAQPAMSQWLKASTDPKYSIYQINIYPTGQYAVQVVSTLAYAWLSDTVCRGARWPPMIFVGCMNILTYSSLAAWNIPRGYKWACFYFAGFSGGLSGLCFAWAHEICSDDNEERALVTATMNEMAYVVQTWLPLLVWQQVDAPEYQKGYITATCISALLIATALTIRVLHHRQIMGKRKQGDDTQSSEDVATPDEEEVQHPKVVKL